MPIYPKLKWQKGRHILQLYLRLGFESIPELHELGLDHGRGLVVVAVACPEERVDLVDEDDAGRDLLRQREHGSGKFLRFAVPSKEEQSSAIRTRRNMANLLERVVACSSRGPNTIFQTALPILGYI